MEDGDDYEQNNTNNINFQWEGQVTSQALANKHLALMLPRKEKINSLEQLEPETDDEVTNYSERPHNDNCMLKPNRTRDLPPAPNMECPTPNTSPNAPYMAMSPMSTMTME